MNYTEFVHLLQRRGKWRKTRDGYLVLCPCHDDREPSLHVTATTDGKILAYCFGCGVRRVPEVLQALGEGRASFQTYAALWEHSESQKYEIYDYLDERENLLYQKLRFYPKTFLFRRVTQDGGFEWKLTDSKGRRLVRKLLYNLPEILQAEQVFIVEGEKDVETLRKHNLPATTNEDGAGKWDEEYNSFLQGKKVVILPDNDPPGRKHAELIAKNLWRVAKEIKVVHLPGLKENEDVTDWFNQGNTPSDLLRLIDETTEWSPKMVREVTLQMKGTSSIILFPGYEVKVLASRVKLHSDGRLTTLLEIWQGPLRLPFSGVVNLAAPQTRATLAKEIGKEHAPFWLEILETTYQKLLEKLVHEIPVKRLEPSLSSQANYLVEDFLPEGLPTLLWGPGGTGKSFLALYLGLCLYEKRVFLNRGVLKQGEVLYLDWETSEQEASRRLSLMSSGPFFLYMRPHAPLEFILDHLYDLILQYQPILVIVDSMSRAVGGSLIESEPVIKFFTCLESLELSALVIHHPPKRTVEAPYGSIFALNAPRCVWEMKTSPRSQGLEGVLINRKTNVGPLLPSLGFRMQFSPHFSLEEVSPSEVMTQLDEVTLEEKILGLLYAEGGLTAGEVATLLKTSHSSVRGTLNRLRQQGKITRLQEGREVRWMLPLTDTPPFYPNEE